MSTSSCIFFFAFFSPKCQEKRTFLVRSVYRNAHLDKYLGRSVHRLCQNWQFFFRNVPARNFFPPARQKYACRDLLTVKYTGCGLCIHFFTDFEASCDIGHNISDCDAPSCDTGVWRGNLYASGVFQNQLIFTLTFSNPDCSVISSGKLFFFSFLFFFFLSFLFSFRISFLFFQNVNVNGNAQ